VFLNLSLVLCSWEPISWVKLDMQNSAHITLANTVSFTLNNASDAYMQYHGAYPLAYVFVAIVVMVVFLVTSIISSNALFIGERLCTHWQCCMLRCAYLWHLVSRSFDASLPWFVN
jgi:hypothetical protein